MGECISMLKKTKTLASYLNLINKRCSNWQKILKKTWITLINVIHLILHSGDLLQLTNPSTFPLFPALMGMAVLVGILNALQWPFVRLVNKLISMEVALISYILIMKAKLLNRKVQQEKNLFQNTGFILHKFDIKGKKCQNH